MGRLSGLGGRFLLAASTLPPATHKPRRTTSSQTPQVADELQQLVTVHLIVWHYFARFCTVVIQLSKHSSEL